MLPLLIGKKWPQQEIFKLKNIYHRSFTIGYRGSHNIEGFKQVSNWIIYIYSNVIKLAYGCLLLNNIAKTRFFLHLIILGKIKTCNSLKNEHIFYIMNITLLQI